MANKPVTTDVVANAQYNSSTLNANFATLEDAIEGCLGRGGTGESPNSMTGDLDMDANDIINVDNISVSTLIVDGSAVTPSDLSDSRFYEDVSSMKLSSNDVGSILETIEYSAGIPNSGGRYVVKTPAQFGGTPDGYGNHYDAAGNVLVLQDLHKVTVKQFGAKFDGSDDTAAIQAALDYLSPFGLLTKLSGGTTSIRSSGNTIEGREYALKVPTGGGLVGAGISRTIISAYNDSIIYDCITDDRTTSTSNIKLDGFTLDGNHDTRPKGGFGIYFKNSSQITLGEVYVTEMTGMGFRFEKCSYISFGTLRVFASVSQPNDDAIHFYDCHDVVGDKALITTGLDDCLIITANTEDTYNFNIGEVVVQGGVSNRAFLLNLGDSATARYNIYNITVDITAKDCDGPAALIYHEADYKNINITVNSTNCVNAFSIDLSEGPGFGTGTLYNSTFDVLSNQDTEYGVLVLNQGTMANNTLNANVYKNGDTYPSISIAGDQWNGTLNINTDPGKTKVTPSSSLDIYGSESIFAIIADNADKGINLRSTAQNNTFNIGAITNMDSYSISNAPGTSVNRFVGGYIEDVVQSVNDNEFYGTKGADNKGNVTLTPDGSGIITIPHGLVQGPGYVNCVYSGAGTYITRVSSVDATNVYVALYDTTGAAVTAGSHKIFWSASI